MKKVIFILFLGFFTTNLIGQEIHSVFKFKKEGKKCNRKCHEIELDSLVLYKNKTYHRTYSYYHHAISYQEQIGTWEIKNNILFLYGIENKDPFSTKSNSEYQYKIKRNRIILEKYIINPEADPYPFERVFILNRKLKRVKNLSRN